MLKNRGERKAQKIKVSSRSSHLLKKGKKQGVSDMGRQKEKTL